MNAEMLVARVSITLTTSKLNADTRFDYGPPDLTHLNFFLVRPDLTNATRGFRP
jgi:hypothetical protein